MRDAEYPFACHERMHSFRRRHVPQVKDLPFLGIQILLPPKAFCRDASPSAPNIINSLAWWVSLSAYLPQGNEGGHF